MSGPLDGVKVVEITQFQNGPVCGRILGDMGADIIKVEPKTGDPARGFMAIIGVQMGFKGRNFYFEYNNRNKRGMVLDLKKEKSKETVECGRLKKRSEKSFSTLSFPLSTHREQNEMSIL